MSMEYKYLLKGVKGIITFSEPLLKEFYKVGSTYEDYLKDCYIPLNKKLLGFVEINPNSSPKEIIECKLKMISPEEELYNYKIKLIDDVYKYDNSFDLKSIQINGTFLWWDGQERSNIQRRLIAEKRLEILTTTLWYKNISFKFDNINDALRLLDQMEVYSAHCKDITNNIINYIRDCKDIKLLLEYNYKKFYPVKPII